MKSGGDGRFVEECSGGDDIFILLSSQLLYSTYLLSSARRTIGVDEEISREVYHRMMPAFEELFDEVEEHALNILLEPWTLLVNQDTESFQKVPPVPQSSTNESLSETCVQSFDHYFHGVRACACLQRCVCGRMCALSTVRSTRSFNVCMRILKHS